MCFVGEGRLGAGRPNNRQAGTPTTTGCGSCLGGGVVDIPFPLPGDEPFSASLFTFSCLRNRLHSNAPMAVKRPTHVAPARNEMEPGDQAPKTDPVLKERISTPVEESELDEPCLVDPLQIFRLACFRSLLVAADAEDIQNALRVLHHTDHPVLDLEDFGVRRLGGKLSEDVLRYLLGLAVDVAV